MTRHKPLSPVRARTVTLMATAITIAVALSACDRAQQPNTKSNPSATTAHASEPGTPTAATPRTSTIPTNATVVGKLDVLIALTTPDSVVPSEPVTYTMLVQPVGNDVSTPYPVAADGSFALPLAPGAYVMSVIEIEATNLGTEPTILPVATSRAVRLHAPSTGCVYGGTISVTYGRLPAGSQKQQQDLVARASERNHENYSFVYRPDGGFVMAGAGVVMSAKDQLPADAQACVAEKFVLVKA